MLFSSQTDVKVDKEKQNLAIVDKLDWGTFRAAAEICGVRDLPEERPTVEAMASDEDLYKKVSSFIKHSAIERSLK